jgi:hypothetical protein
VDKSNLSPEWKAFRKKLLRLLKDAVRLYGRKNRLKTVDYDRLKMKLKVRLEQFLTSDHTDKDVKRLIKRLKRHKSELFTFLDYDNVSPYNNHAEQQMRKPVITRKVSQQNRSEQGAKTHAIMMTLFRSAELQEKNPVENVLTLAKIIIGKDIVQLQKLKLAA